MRQIHRPAFYLILTLLLAAAPSAGADVLDDLKQVADGLGIAIRNDAFKIDAGGQPFEGAEVPEARWREAAGVLLGELKAYPKSFLRQAKIELIHIVLNLKLNNAAQPSLCQSKPGRIWIDAAGSDYDRRVLRRAIAQNIYRALPFSEAARREFDEQWSALNIEGFRYGGINVRADRPRQLAGFFREGDVTSIETDQASVFAFLMTDVQRINQRSQRDPVIAAKVRAMRNLLARITPDFNDAYFTAADRAQQLREEDDRQAVMPLSRGYVPAQLAHLAARYGIEIIYLSVPGFTRIGDPPADAQLNEYASILTSELSRYDPAIIRTLELKRIVIVGKFAPAFAGAQAITFRDIDAMYFSTTGADAEDLRATVHHELLHLIDGADDGEIDHDDAWTATNQSGFVYLHGKSGKWQEATPGFVSTYAQSAVCEDKAETYSFLMTRHADMLRRARNEPVLAAKIALMKKRLAAFHPGFDDRFWQQSARDSVMLKQRYVPGRWIITSTFDVEKDLDEYGRVSEWGGGENLLVVNHPDAAGNYSMVLQPTRIRHTMRAVGVTMVYDSNDPPKEQDATLARWHRFVVDQPFTVLVNSEARIREVRGFDRVLARAEEEDDLAYTVLKGGKNKVMDALRYGSLVEVQDMLQPHAVRVGQEWRGKTTVQLPEMSPIEVPCYVTFARNEGGNAVLTFFVSLEANIKEKDAAGKESESKLAGVQKGQFTMDLRTGMVTSAETQLTIRHKNKPAKATLTMKCRPE